eukprot:jgi/Picsp_1/324/NSC_00323-R1_---NA---
MKNHFGICMEDIMKKRVLEGLWLSREQACLLAIVDAFFKTKIPKDGSQKSLLRGALIRFESGSKFYLRFVESTSLCWSDLSDTKAPCPDFMFRLFPGTGLEAQASLVSSANLFSEENWNVFGQQEVTRLEYVLQVKGIQEYVVDIVDALWYKKCILEWAKGVVTKRRSGRLASSSSEGKGSDDFLAGSTGPIVSALEKDLDKLQKMMDHVKAKDNFTASMVGGAKNVLLSGTKKESESQTKEENKKKEGSKQIELASISKPTDTKTSNIMDAHVPMKAARVEKKTVTKDSGVEKKGAVNRSEKVKIQWTPQPPGPDDAPLISSSGRQTVENPEEITAAVTSENRQEQSGNNVAEASPKKAHSISLSYGMTSEDDDDDDDIATGIMKHGVQMKEVTESARHGKSALGGLFINADISEGLVIPERKRPEGEKGCFIDTSGASRVPIWSRKFTDIDLPGINAKIYVSSVKEKLRPDASNQGALGSLFDSLHDQDGADADDAINWTDEIDFQAKYLSPMFDNLYKLNFVLKNEENFAIVAHGTGDGSGQAENAGNSSAGERKRGREDDELEVSKQIKSSIDSKKSPEVLERDAIEAFKRNRPGKISLFPTSKDIWALPNRIKINHLSKSFTSFFDIVWKYELNMVNHLRMKGTGQKVAELHKDFPLPFTFQGNSDQKFTNFLTRREYLFQKYDTKEPVTSSLANADKVMARRRAPAMLEWKRRVLSYLKKQHGPVLLTHLFIECPFSSDTPDDELQFCRKDPQYYLEARFHGQLTIEVTKSRGQKKGLVSFTPTTSSRGK